jgi:hypothetical protein
MNKDRVYLKKIKYQGFERVAPVIYPSFGWKYGMESRRKIENSL